MIDTPTWFSTELRQKRLYEAARAWMGTPFASNGSTKGPRGGVSCQKLVGALLQESGCREDLDVPEVPMNHWEQSRDSLIEKFMSGRSDFVKLQDGEVVSTGDILTFKLGQCEHHLGVSLWGSNFVHVMSGSVVKRSSLFDGTWLKRHVNTWRALP